VVTDQIDTFTERGLQLKSGKHLDADIVVTATGLVLRLMSGLQLTVDGAPVDLSKTITYKGMMYSDVPNLASAFGYTNASWTLKCDFTADYVSQTMSKIRSDTQPCCPRPPRGLLKSSPGLVPSMPALAIPDSQVDDPGTPEANFPNLGKIGIRS
jgi:monooxygenase